MIGVSIFFVLKKLKNFWSLDIGGQSSFAIVTDRGVVGSDEVVAKSVVVVECGAELVVDVCVRMQSGRVHGQRGLMIVIR